MNLLNPFRFEAPVTPVGLLASATAQNPNGTSVTTPAIDSSGSSLIVIFVSWYANVSWAVIPDISDSKTNTPWTMMTRRNGNNSFSTGMWYKANPPNLGSGHTFTASKGITQIYPSIGVACFSNIKLVSPLDQESGNKSTGPTVQPGNLTPTEANELLVASLYHNANVAASIDSGFTLLGEQHAASGLTNFAFAYKVQTAATTENPTFTATGAGDMSCALASFKHA